MNSESTQSIETICNAIKTHDLTVLRDCIHKQKFGLISIKYNCYLKSNGTTKTESIPLQGKPFFHLIAYKGDLHTLQLIHQSLSIPIIQTKQHPGKLQQNPYQHMWSLQKKDLLIYCMSMSQESDFDRLLETLNINITSEKEAGSCGFLQTLSDLHSQQSQWLAEHNWPGICQAIYDKELIIPVLALCKYEKTGLIEHINKNDMALTINEYYCQLKAAAMHEKNMHDRHSQQREKKLTMFQQADTSSKYTKIGLGWLTVASIFALGYFYSRSANEENHLGFN